MNLWEWIPATAAAERLNVSLRFVRRCVDAGKVSAVRIDGVEFVWLNDVAERQRAVGLPFPSAIAARPGVSAA